MKNAKHLLLLLVWASASLGAFAHTHREKITKELSFDPKKGLNVLRVENIDGCVRVVPYGGDKVVFEVERIIQATTEQGLRQAKEELVLEFRVSGGSIISFLRAPFIHSPRTNCGQNPQPNLKRKRNYDFTHHVTIKVPQNANPSLITEKNGTQKVKKVPAKQTKPSHIIGPVLLENIVAHAETETMNGNAPEMERM